MKARFFLMAAAIAGLSLNLVSCPTPGAAKPSTTTRSVLYVAYNDLATGFLASYAIDEKTGALTPTAGSAIAAGSIGIFVGTASAGRFAYVGDGAGEIWEFHVNALTGTPSAVPSTPLGVGSQPQWAAADPTGRFLYVPMPQATTPRLQVFSINQLTGKLTQVAASGPIGAPQAAAAVPSGSFVYVSDAQTPGSLWGFAVDPSTGLLTPVPGTPFAVGTAAYGIAIDPEGKFLYAANLNDSTISAFSINQTTGTLSFVRSVLTDTGPLLLVIDPKGRFLYSAQSGSMTPPVSTIAGFKIDPTTGALSSVPGSPLMLSGPGIDATFPAIDPSGQFLYAGDSSVSGSQFHAYRVDQASGALSELPGSPYTIAGAASITVLSASAVTVPGQ